MITCPNCNKNFIDGTRFCTVCGSNLEEMHRRIAEEEERRKKDPIEKLKRIPKKMWAIGGCVAVVAIVVFVTVFSMLNSVSKDKYVVYLKDGELYLDMLNVQGPFAITEGLTKETTENVALTYKDFYLEILTELSNDGKTVFYPANMSKNLDFDLYYRSTSKYGAEGEKIAENVSQYRLSPDGDFLIYYNDDGLFLYNYEEEEKIGEGLRQYRISKDCRIVYYVTEENNLYRWEKGKGSLLVAEASNLVYVSEDFSTIYYESNGIYVSKNGQEGVLISDMAMYLQAYENGTMYYIKYETDKYYMSDYVTDDCLEVDQEVEHLTPPDYYLYPWPEKPENPTTEELAEYEDAYAKMYAQYKAEMDAYIAQEQKEIEKEKRDAIRKQIASQTCVVSRNALYYYDGEKSIKVADNMARNGNGDFTYIASGFNASAAMYVRVYTPKEGKKLYLSEIQDVSAEIGGWKSSLQPAELQSVICTQEKSVPFEKRALSVVIFSKDGSKMYVTMGAEQIVYEINLNEWNGELGEYDTNVYPATPFITPLENGSLMYFKDVESYGTHMKATLYIDKEAIEEDVLYAKYPADKDNNIYFFRDFDEETGELCCYRDGEVIEIDKDVYIMDFSVTEEGGVFYLKEYDTEEKQGKLYYSENCEPGKCIDKEVSGIVKP